ncbi:MAG: hypothetical protein IH966_03145 [Gemmatimonadetes bacterium]|nr:hypothetical protein [Gemmatimonadota bacterium]
MSSVVDYAPGPTEDVVPHCFGEAPGVGILAGGVVGAQHDGPVRQDGLGAVDERGPVARCEFVPPP